MPNETVFNQNSQPLYTEQVNTYIAPGIDTLPEAGAAMSGLLFGIPFASTVGTSTPLVLQIANPGGSGRTLYISRIIASTGTASVTLTLLRNATVGGWRSLRSTIISGARSQASALPGPQRLRLQVLRQH